MKLTELLDIELLKNHIAEGFVNEQSHPMLPLKILNYSHLAQFTPKWGDGTIDYCRGLIFDNETKEIVARPFKKFHNLNTPSIPETLEENLPAGTPTITQKMDGSLGILYNEIDIATRGSFTSDQAKWASAWYQQHIAKEGGAIWPLGWTPLFEIIYNENRIVVEYPFEGLVLIGMINIETGEEMDYAGLRDSARRNDIRLTKELTGFDLEQIKLHDYPNEEGYVATYSNGLKVKIKFEEYKRLHRIVTGMNPHTVWASLSQNKPLPDTEKLPNNFALWMAQWATKLETEYGDIEYAADEIYRNRPFREGDDRLYRAACALAFKRMAGDRIELLPVAFAKLDGDRKRIESTIWKMIEPRGDDKSFLTTTEMDAALAQGCELYNPRK